MLTIIDKLGTDCQLIFSSFNILTEYSKQILCRLHNLLNVYLPYECEDNRYRYNDYMSKIVAFCNDINSTCIFIVGDFNADISKSSAFGRILHDFCDDFSFSIVDNDYLPADTYTYVSSAWGTTSWLDHVICTADARECITDMTVLYECICSDHHPLLFCIDFDFVPAYGTGSTSENKRAIHWDSLRPCDINNYTDYTKLELNKIKVPQGIKWNDPNCRNHIHREEIDELYDSIVIALKKCSDALVSTGKRRAKDVIVPGWNEQVKELHVEARHAYLTW